MPRFLPHRHVGVQLRPDGHDGRRGLHVLRMQRCRVAGYTLTVEAEAVTDGLTRYRFH